MASISKILRRRLWRTICSLAGGLTTTGAWPTEPGGKVVVANHASHADTAALLAAIPAKDGPVFAAAADYWFDVWWRRALITGLAGGLAVHRGEHGGYAELLAAARPALAAGRTVVIYPEGTRSTDGSVAEFHSGAVRLARDCKVPVIPVAVLGTGDVLAKHGAFRATPMEVRFGAPVDPASVEADELRSIVVSLLAEHPVRVRRSPVWRAVRRLTDVPQGVIFGCAWGFAEAVSWPIMAEMALVFVGVAEPRRIPAMAAAITAGSVSGVLLTATLAKRGVRAPAPLTTPAMYAAAARHLEAGPVGIWHQALGGIPVKVYARVAGEAGLPMGRLAAATLAERGARMAACAAGIMVAEHPARPIVRRLYGSYLVVMGSAFAVGLRRVVRAWDRPA
ncbi:1-acyl-sn-glycerol-3-phosphate acyltransferase [Calidifontibacter sp. DB0510]|uniref:1-acyl-sn-glycerol-3-phosphate acyltransferase n=1 Tax=Metallococcus carri TaxID=1656884 RepID=A0A967B0D3_9MICO|nr:lysophospholipid acyltransferase family protein [Metallococcus carri]NHN55988.1 1-acyl-sn-glycerol-3-phosphate acyltransferase [Metallococcus carri]NOP37555.1 1-acyl-sn-glycerol-3-phosphate acyltransferase [Calidifontibacter sp. DB2511S]